jgi:hypothetical protein
MDPYLEGHLWLSFHGDFCTEIKRQLAPKLRPRYFPFSTRYYLPEDMEEVVIAREQIIPDVGVVQQSSDRLTGPAAVLAAPCRMHVVMSVPVPHYRIEIREIANRELVCAIEFLSPTNKRDPGRGKYRKKRERLLASTAHLIEIDLLRRGQRPPMREQYPAGDYFVLLSRFEDRPESEVWPIALQASLPKIPVPLGEGDPDVELDLQQALATVYDLGGYQTGIDYQKPPDVPLSHDQEAWADQLLRTAGLRV